MVVALTASDVGDIATSELSRISLMKVEAGQWQPVAFQLDEMDEHNLVWFQETGFDIRGEANKFDERDQLLFMWADAGFERASASNTASLAEGYLLAEIQLSGVGGNNRFVYLVADNPLRSSKFYVTHDPESGVTKTDHYLLTTDPKNELNWSFLGYQGYTGPANASIIDSLRMKMSGGLFMSFARMSLDNDNLKPKLRAFKLGPIRSVMHLETKVVFAGLPMMKMHVQALRFTNHFEAHTYAHIPDLYKATLKKPIVQVSIDGNVPAGAVVQTARGKELETLLDGKIDESELLIKERGLTTDESWILFDSKKNFALVTILNVPESLKGIPLGLVYEDTLAEKRNDRFAGQQPELGYLLKGWPPGNELRFSLQMFFERNLAGTSPDHYVMQRSGEDISVDVEVLNPSL